MDLEKIFTGLESNRVQECEDSKQELINILAACKEQWLVTCMMEYFIKTGSLRIIEVLVKVQPPHDTYIFDRLDDWIKISSSYRTHALNLFLFIVRKHPIWLFKLEKHRLIRNIIKLLQTERDIVTLVVALLCIITLLPIIPNSVTNFLNDLFELFGYLATWNCQNTKALPEDKIVHLQLGLQMLFQCLYGMFPINFLTYLNTFVKKEKSGIFQHTIKPLLETVRMHPMLVTATAESEMSSTRWKDMEPHDVVMECSKLALPLICQDLYVDHSQSKSSEFSIPDVTYWGSSSSISHTTTTTSTTISTSNQFSYQIRDFYKQCGPVERFSASDNYNGTIWSPYNEITTSGIPPLTPTPVYMLPLSGTASQLHSQMTSVSGSSPPEAAVEATPETTPMKDIRQSSLTASAAISKPNAVSAIFVSSQPSSPMRNEINQFQYPPQTEHKAKGNIMARNMTPIDRKVEQIMRDRHYSQSLYEETSDETQIGSEVLYEKFQHNQTKRQNYKTSVSRVRRTKSCSSVYSVSEIRRNRSKLEFETGASGYNQSINPCENRLQKSGKMLSIATATKKTKVATVSVGSQTVETVPETYESVLFGILKETNKHSNAYESQRCSHHPQQILDNYILTVINDSGCNLDQEKFKLLCCLLQYERYRRGIHAERNRRLLGRSRDKRSLEMERDRLREQLKNFEEKNKEFIQKVEKTKTVMSEREHSYQEELKAVQAKYQSVLELNKYLKQENEDLQVRLNKELTSHKEVTYEVEALRGQIFNLSSELQHAQEQMEIGLQCKQELARLEAEFIVMGEIQVKCRDRLAELDVYKARDEELQMLQESYNAELKELKHTLEEKTSHYDSVKHKIIDLQTQLMSSEKIITEQKRLLKSVKDEYEEKLKSLNKKYDVQKTIIMQMEEKIIMSLQKPQPNSTQATYSPDTDKTDVASSMDHNSPLSTSLASSESLSLSLRSTELRNLHQIVETTGPGALEASCSNVGVHPQSTIAFPTNTASTSAAAPQIYEQQKQ